MCIVPNKPCEIEQQVLFFYPLLQDTVKDDERQMVVRVSTLVFDQMSVIHLSLKPGAEKNRITRISWPDVSELKNRGFKLKNFLRTEDWVFRYSVHSLPITLAKSINKSHLSTRLLQN